MRKTCPLERLSLAVLVSLAAAGCQQMDQELPFELAEGEIASLQIGPSGGTVSLPPSFSLNIPASALASSVSVDVTERISGPFPSDAGTPVPGTAYDVGPVGTALAMPGHVQIAVDSALLEVGEAVRLSVAIQRSDGSVSTFPSNYDVANGVLTADIDELGPVAAVVSFDAIELAAGLPEALGGGSFPPPPAPAPGPAGAPAYGGVEFSASCSPEARQCFSSGVIRVWADDVVRRRMGDDLWLLDPTVSGSIEFLDYDAEGVPRTVVGTLSMDGDLRARFNSTVSHYDLAEGTSTGPGVDPIPTSLSISSNVMVFGETTSTGGDVIESNFEDEAEFEVTGIGTSEMLVVRVESEIEFENSDGSFETGLVVAHVRLRR